MNKKQQISALALVALILLVIIAGVWLSARKQPLVIQGQMDAQQTDIAAKISGRIGKILVHEGETIDVGTPLIEMNTPEISAKIEQAQAAQQAAEAVAQKAQNGARPQEVEMARANWQRAQAAADLAQTSYRRVDNLAREGLISRQKRDEAYTNYIAAQKQAEAAKAQYDMAYSGARSEDKAAAEAQAKQVSAVVKEVEVAQNEANLRSPIKGEVADVIAKVGEIVPQGVPIVTLTDLNDQWVVLNVREDAVHKFAIGQEFTGELPALTENGKPIKARFKVYASSVLPDFATWRATRNNSGFDMRTFEIKARPAQPIAHVRPGMSVLVTVE